MEPRLYPLWEPKPLQELDPELRQAVEGVRGEPMPQDAIQRALERAEQIPSKPFVPRPWFRRKFFLAAAAVAASLLLGLGLWAALTTSSAEPGSGTPSKDYAITFDTVPGKTYGERDRLQTGTSALAEESEPADFTVRDVERATKPRPTSERVTTDCCEPTVAKSETARKSVPTSTGGTISQNLTTSGSAVVTSSQSAPLPSGIPVPPTMPPGLAPSLPVADSPKTPPGPTPLLVPPVQTVASVAPQPVQPGSGTEKITYYAPTFVPPMAPYTAPMVRMPLLPAIQGGPMGGPGAGNQPVAQPGPVAFTFEAAQGTEAYSHFVDNPFQAAAQTPLSTFATTVDTASYSNVRRFLLQEKRLPPPDAVRVAELINYFPYKYAGPKDQHPVAFTLNIVECPWNRQHHLLRIAMKGREYNKDQMPARNFVFLIDTSGSMYQPNRLPLLKKSLALLVEQLTDRDRVAMVAYAGSAGLVLPSTPGNEKKKILDALNQLEAGGSTNGGDGIVLAYKVAQENFIQEGLNRVILGTDGDFNVGVTNQGDLVRLIEEKKKSGVFLTILGYGMGNVKDATMEKLAYHGNGHYAYIDTEAEARKVFVEQGASLLAIAKDVKLQVEFNPRRVGAYRLLGYENRMLKAEDFNDDRKHGGSIGDGHTVTALYEIIPAGLPIPTPGVDPLRYRQPVVLTGVADSGEWLTVKLRYKHPESDTSKLLVQPLVGAVVKLTDAPEDCRFAAAVALFGMLLRKSEQRGSSNWASVRKLAENALGADTGKHRGAFLELITAAADLDKAGLKAAVEVQKKE